MCCSILMVFQLAGEPIQLEMLYVHFLVGLVIVALGREDGGIMTWLFKILYAIVINK